MTYTLKNQCLTVEISSLGAELQSIKGATGCEYLWQGDPAYWDGRSPLLFPICGRLQDASYTHNGKDYTMKLHGFARAMEFSCLAQTDTQLVLYIEDNADTRICYPFAFALTLTYTLSGNALSLSARMENRGGEPMPVTFGGHPGFRVPPEDDTDFSDWYLEFGEECDPDMIEIVPSGLQSGIRTSYPLVNRRILPLSHELFVIDGVFLSRMARKVTLKSQKSARAVTLIYPEMPYLGIWQTPQSDAPLLCIEPWCGLPDFEGRKTEITQKSEMFHILPNTAKTVGYDMIFD